MPRLSDSRFPVCEGLPEVWGAETVGGEIRVGLAKVHNRTDRGGVGSVVVPERVGVLRWAALTVVAVLVP